MNSQFFLEALARQDYIRVWKEYSNILSHILTTLLKHNNEKIRGVVTALIRNDSNAHDIIVGTIRYLMKNCSEEQFLKGDNVIRKRITNLKTILDIDLEDDGYLYPPYFQSYFQKIVQISLQELVSLTINNTNMTFQEAQRRRDIYIYLNNRYKMINETEPFESSLWWMEMQLIGYMYQVYTKALEQMETKDMHINNLNLLSSNTQTENITMIQKLKHEMNELSNINDTLKKQQIQTQDLHARIQQLTKFNLEKDEQFTYQQNQIEEINKEFADKNMEISNLKAEIGKLKKQEDDKGP